MAITFPSTAVSKYTDSKQLIGGNDINKITGQLNTGKTAIVLPNTSTTQLTAIQLNNHVNVVSSVVTAANASKLPIGFVGAEVWVQNDDAANALQMFTYGAGTIQAQSGAAVNGATTGLAQAHGTLWIYKCVATSIANGIQTDTWRVFKSS